MLFNPLKVPDGENVLKYYKELNKYKEFKADAGEGIDNNKLMQYIMLVYDINSPYREKYSDIVKRKIEAAHDVEFEVEEGGSFASPVEDFLKGNNEKVNRKIVAFCRLHRNFKYSFLVTIESSYYNVMLEILNGETKKISEARTIQQELEETLLDMLNGDKDANLKDELLKYMEDERLGLRPEDIAQKLQDKQQPV